MSATTRVRGGNVPRLGPAYDLFGDPSASAPPAPGRPATRPQAAPVAPPQRPPAEPAPEPRTDPQPPRALRLRRDFAAARELVWGGNGRRFVCRNVEHFNGRPAYHVYTAWELGDEKTHREVVRTRSPSASGVLSFGRVDTRRRPVDRARAEVTPAGVRLGKSPPSSDLRAPFDWQLACAAEARDLIRELCPETVRRVISDRGVESVPTSGVYDRPNDVLLAVDPAHRFAAAKAAWRPTA